MKTKLTYLFILLLSFTSKAQEIKLPLYKASFQLFKGSIYAFGITKQKKTSIKVYKISSLLTITDSIDIPLSNTPAEDFLLSHADTLHDFLNIYIQKKDQKDVRIIRVSSDFKIKANIFPAEISRLNNSQLFSGSTLRYKKFIFDLHFKPDSTGRQYYLNKYELKSDTLNFEYTLLWQFPFERKRVEWGHVFYANDKSVFIYVHVVGGKKSGQWVLNTNASTGKLLKATRLNFGEEKDNYLFSTFRYDHPSKSLMLVGQKFSSTQYVPEKRVLSINNLNQANLYLLQLDSLGEITGRFDFIVPINDAAISNKKNTTQYIIKPYALEQVGYGKLILTSDNYKTYDNTGCYTYVNSQTFILSQNEEVWQMDKTSIYPNSFIEKFLYTNDKRDMNGKICNDSLIDFPSLYIRKPSLEVKLNYNPYPQQSWLLTKSNLKKNTLEFQALIPYNNTFQLKNLIEINKDQTPLIFSLNPQKAIIGFQPEPAFFQLKIANW